MPVWNICKVSWVRLDGRGLQGRRPVAVFAVQRVDRNLHRPGLLSIRPISEDIAQGSPVVALPRHPQQAKDCETKLAHPPNHLAVQVDVSDESPAEGEESDPEFSASPSHDEEVDGGEVCPRDADTLRHETSVRLRGLALPVDEASNQGVAAASGDDSNREADGLRPIGSAQKSVVNLVDEPVSRDDDNPTPGGEVEGGEDLLSMASTLGAKNLPNNSSLLLGKSSEQNWESNAKERKCNY